MGGGSSELSWAWLRLPVAMMPDLVREVAEPEAALKLSKCGRARMSGAVSGEPHAMSST